VNGDVPAAVTLRFVLWPDVMDVSVGCTEIDGGVHDELTVTVAAVLSAGGAHCPVTRTQYEVVVVGLTITDELVAPPIGLDVLPLVPVYH